MAKFTPTRAQKVALTGLLISALMVIFPGLPAGLPTLATMIPFSESPSESAVMGEP